MTEPAAFLVYSGRLYFARAGSDRTPVCRLIEGIWNLHPDRAFHLLRCRILVNYPLTHSCRGAIKVAAKRSTVLAAEEFARRFASHADRIEVDETGFLPNAFAPPHGLGSDQLQSWMRSYPFSSNDRPVLAVLVDPHGVPMIAAVNTASSNRFHHAEVNLVTAYRRQWNGKIPHGFRIVVSLKPCCMCAGYIADHCEDGVDTPVTYLEDDPGPKARGSVLRRMHLPD